MHRSFFFLTLVVLSIPRLVQAQPAQVKMGIDSGTEDRFFLATNGGRLELDTLGNYITREHLYAPDLDHNWLEKVGGVTKDGEWEINFLDTFPDHYVLKDLDITNAWHLVASQSRFAHCDFIYRIPTRDSALVSLPLFQIEYTLKLKNARGRMALVRYDSVTISAAGCASYIAGNPSEEREILQFPDTRYRGLVGGMIAHQYAVVSRREPTQLDGMPGYSLVGIECAVKRLRPGTLYVRGLRVRSDAAKPRVERTPISELPEGLRPGWARK